ncbi:MAG: response regulator [Nitrospiraceae bacterium]|nr:MAG: response regulator [Nitrospiraceae bacterium]
MKILVVDDEQLVRWFLDRALRKSGHEVITASGILDAFNKLQSEDFQVLFLDLRMPEGNGTELLGKLEQLNRKPKVIVCSAFITSELEEEFKNKGICTLKKPFKLEELNSTLKRCLS